MTTLRLELPTRLDLSVAEPLAEDLRAKLGADLVIDAVHTTHLGTPGLQVLIAARKSWAASGQSLSIENFCEGLADQLASLGLSIADLVVRPTPDQADVE